MISTKKTKIIATIGPSCDKEETLEKLVSLGMDAARLNFSHGSHKDHGDNIKKIRKIEKKLNKHVAIIADIQGPKIRIGNLPETGIELKVGQEITIDTGTREYYDNRIPLPSLMFRDGTKEGHIAFLDDGNMQIKITSKYGGLFKAIIIRGGVLFSKKGVNVPSLEINSSILSAKDKADIEFSVKAGVDFIALSFLRNANDVKEARKFLGKTKVKIIAKIERPEALVNINEIIDQADVVMVARGDLGIETPLWELPIRQKEIIELVREKMKSAIVATQMLDSMIRNSIPTRAEVSDVANAVFDSTDAVMLSGETASGRFPLGAVDMMRKILESTDSHQKIIDRNLFNNITLESMSIAKSAIHIAEDAKAKAIIIEANDEILAQTISHFRPTMPIIASTKNQHIAKILSLVWGITPFVVKNKKWVEATKKILISNNFLKKGDKIVCIHSKKKRSSAGSEEVEIETI